MKVKHNQISRYWRIVLLLAMSFVYGSMFNELWAQDAFYVYRNDGDFNGFFYDEVIRMGYSKFDLDSVEYDVFVVQEIETKDSLYRIPLAVIDSIGFQQPEIRFSEKFHNFDEMGILPEYIKVRDRNTVYLYLPEGFKWWKLNLKVGDTFATMDTPMYREVGFSGKLIQVYDMGEYTDSYMEKPPKGSHVIRLGLAPLDSYGDVFDQFITTERVFTDSEGNVRRRIAGLNPDGTIRSSQYRAEDNAPRTDLFKIESTISKSWEPKEGVNIDLGADVEMKVGMQVTYNCSWKRVFVKIDIPADFAVTPMISVKSSKSFEATVDGVPKFLKAIKFPVQCPIFQTLPVPELVVRGSGELSAKINFPQVGFGLASTFIFDSDNLLFPTQFYFSKRETGKEADSDVVDTGSAELCLSGFLQMALKFSANIETCDWFSNLLFCRIGLDFFVGPKVSGNLKLASFSAYKENPEYLYSAFTGNGIDLTGLSCDLEAKGTLGYLFRDKEERQFLSSNLSFFQVPFRMIPQAKRTTYQVKPGYPKGRIIAEVTTRNRTLLPTYVGVRYSDQDRKYSYLSHMFTTDSLTSKIELDLPPGHYTLRPCFKTMDVEYDLSSSASDYLGYEGRINTQLDLLPMGLEKVSHYCLTTAHSTVQKKGTYRDGTTFDTTTEADYQFSSNRLISDNGFGDLNAEITKKNDSCYVVTGEKTIEGATMKLTMDIKIIDGLAYITNGILEYAETKDNKAEDKGTESYNGRNVRYHYTVERATEDHWTFSFKDVFIPRNDNNEKQWRFACGYPKYGLSTKNIELNRKKVYTVNEQWDLTDIKDPSVTWTEKANRTETTTDVRVESEDMQRVEFTLTVLTPDE